MEHCSLLRRFSRRLGAGSALALAVPLVVGMAVPTASAAGGALPAAATTAATPVGYTPLTPVRICDTRAVQPETLANQCNSSPSGTDRLGPGGTLAVVVGGQNGVPATATAAVLNVTVTNTDSASFLTVWPSGQPFPLASNLNWVPGQTVPNLVEVPIGTAGLVNFFNNRGDADVVIDLEGYTSPAALGLYHPMTPTRVCDTRAVAPDIASNECNGNGASPAKLAAGQTLIAPVGGVGGVPVTATAVVLNVTVTNTSAASFLTVFPHGATQPLASNLNWLAGQTLPNRVIVPVPLDGKVDFFNDLGATDVVVDVGGYFAPLLGSGYVPVTPARICDTRPAQGTLIPANPCNAGGLGKLGAGQSLVMPVAGQGGVPTTGATAVVINVTVTDTSAASFLTVWPSGVTRPTASDLNWVAGTTVPNLVVVQVGADGKVDLFNNLGTTDVAADVEGYYM